MDEDADYNTIENNNIEAQQGLQSKVFEMFNTATATGVTIPLADGGTVVAEGDMGYWESDEFYPDKKPEIWNASEHPWSDNGNPEAHDLCGKRIRHHKFPENTVYAGSSLGNTITNHYKSGEDVIRVMGVAFENIQPPVDNEGIPIPNIVGYEIMRGSRNGNRTVMYKGIINNMKNYEIVQSAGETRIGLYPNYPFNPVLTTGGQGQPDWFTSRTEVNYEPQTGETNQGTPTNPNQYTGYRPITSSSAKHFTFHSPDTNFFRPTLGQKELKIYGAAYGVADGNNIEVEDHPEHVFVTDLTFYAGLIIGVGYAVAKWVGKRTVTYQTPSWYKYPKVAGGFTGVYSKTAPASNIQAGIAPVLNTANQTSLSSIEGLNKNFINLLGAITGVNTGEVASNSMQNGFQVGGYGTGMTKQSAPVSYVGKSGTPPLMAALYGGVQFLTNVGEGADLAIELIRNASKERQYALQYQGYCGYEKFAGAYNGNRRRLINEAVYLKGHLQNFLTTHRINNLLRIQTVAFDTTINVDSLIGGLRDGTMDNMRVSDMVDPFGLISNQASSHYVGFKTRLRSQYGQINSIQQLPTGCILPSNDIDTGEFISKTGTIFGGDTYIGKYQEKNTFYHFYKWMLDEPDRAIFNYHNFDTIQHAAFWMNTRPFDVQSFTSSITSALADAIDNGSVQTFFQQLVTPSDLHCFDRVYTTGNAGGGVFTIKNSYIYLFHSSVRDFYVETELNIDMRDWETDDVKTQHWDVLSDLRTMFRASHIKAGNYYKIDKGLSVDYLPYSKLSWGVTQDREYDPTLAETCFKHYPRRLQYSLPQETMLKRDNWSVFLGNNYKDFASKVTSIKAISSTGILLLFENQSPGIYPGVDELQLKSGTSITVGDGGLFQRQMQRISNTDIEFEYGSSQSRKGAINTPAGLFYISQNQGKVFQVGKSLKEITLQNNQHWFNQYLPYQILLDFPDFDLLDNTIAGVGCQALYDNEWGVVYFTKRDFRAKPEFLELMEYEGNGIFVVDQITRVQLGDPIYFDDASWTVSYDPKNGQDISFHDWHPNLSMSGKNNFLTVKGNGIWAHNKRCDSYCNFYGVDYPWEIEFQVDNLPAVTTLRSIEYFMQVFEFDENCRDRFHNLEFNFDEAVIYNSEQVSGLLKLNLAPKNDVRALKDYPIVGLNEINTVFSKVEQKYRVNQFWDITRDRGEFSPTVNESIWETEPNGYIKNLNPINLNYSKDQLQRKKMRHNNNRILLRRTVSGNKKMLMIMNNTKIQNSPR